MLVFGDAITEAKYIRELRAAIREQFAVSKSRNQKVIAKGILKKNPHFAQAPELVENIVREELASEE
jgi:hypothetical protein